MFNHMALGAKAWLNVPCFKLSICFLVYDSGMDLHFVRYRGSF